MTIRPLDDRIAVRKLETLPDGREIIGVTAEKMPQNRGEVLAVGPGRRDKRGNRRPLAVNIGDVVFYGRFWDYDADGIVIVQEADIIGVERSDGGHR